ncbi:hypothetical protein ACFLY2_01900 [Patescibacteria group bacterium]
MSCSTGLASITFDQEFSRKFFRKIYLGSSLSFSFNGVSTIICPAIVQVEGQNIG